jgi:hypothetical protein
MTGWLPLYLRARQVPAAVAISAGAVLAVALVRAALSGQDVSAGLAALTTALALSPLIPTLGGNDAALEGTVAMPWRLRRAAHLLICSALVTGLLVLARVLGTDFGASGQIARNAAGLTGLAGLLTAATGAALSWQVPIAMAGVQSFFVLPDGPQWRQAALWLVQPADNLTAALTAGALLLAGTAAYAVRVGPPLSPAETTRSG